MIFLFAQGSFLPDVERWAAVQSKLRAALLEPGPAGEKFFQEGDYSKAIPRFEIALRTSLERKDAAAEAPILMRLGLAHWNLGRIEESTAFYQRAEEAADAHHQNDIREECATVLHIHQLYAKGKSRRLAGQFERSIQLFEEAVRLSQSVRSAHHEIKCLRQMSINYWEMSKAEEYFKLNDRGRILAHENNNRREEGIFFNNIGLYYWKKNEFSSALNNFHSSLEIARREAQPQNLSDSLTNLGLVHMDLGDYDEALECLHQGILIDQDLGNGYNLATDLNNLGNVYLNKGIQAGGDAYFDQALETFYNALILAQRIQDKKIQTIVQNNIGELFFARHQDGRALDFYSRALSGATSGGFPELACALNNNIGNVHLRQGNHPQAIRFYRRSIDIAAAIDFKKILWESAFGLAQCHEKNGDLRQASEYFKNSIDVIDKTRSQIAIDNFKVGYSRNKSKVYESFIDLIYRVRKKGAFATFEENLFHHIEKAKARAFIEVLMAQKLDIPVMSDALSAEPYSLTDLRKVRLDDRTAVLEYFLGEQRSLLLFITKEKCDIFALPPRPRVEASIKGYIKYLSSLPGIQVDRYAVAKRIFKELLPPLEGNHPAGIEKFIIVPDGLLYHLPFESLAMPSRNGGDRYLIEKYQVSYMPSMSALRLIQDNSEGNIPYRGLLAFGHPVMDSAKRRTDMIPVKETAAADIRYDEYSTLPPLPYSKKEIDGLAKYFKNDRRFVYLDRDANEDVLRRKGPEQFQIVHFACHGVLDELQPLRSALVLSRNQNGRSDGIFQVRELYELKLPSNLVILSACQTGKGALEKGEGFIGLQRAFFYAGARSVVSTLWSVRDKSTALFMEKYYGHLAEGQSKALALRMAKQDMIASKYSHPYYWAGFVLNGEPDSKISMHR